jgi:hypothetical protein
MNRFKKSVAAAMLAVSLGGGGTFLAANTHLLAFTADAGMPTYGGDKPCSLSNPCYLK